MRRLDEEIRFQPADTVVVLGDFVDRGSDSRGVIEFVLELSRRCRLIALRGNHEDMMLKGRANRALAREWLLCGGHATLDSYGASSLDDIPNDHWDFLESTTCYHEGEQDFFVHGSADPSLPLEDQHEVTLLWENIGHFPGRHVSGKRMLCGHSEQRSGQPLDFGHAVCIDTFAYGGGWLTCLETRTDLYWQASQRGDLRQDSL